MKNMVFLLGFLWMGCQAASNQQPLSNDHAEVHQTSDTTIIKSFLHGKKETYFYFVNQYLMTQPPFVVSGNSETKLVHDKPLFLISATKEQNIYIIFPGDSIQVINDKNGNIALQCPGKSMRNHELRFFDSLYMQDNLMQKIQLYNGDKTFQLKANNLDYGKWQKLARQKLNDRMLFLHNYDSLYPMSNEFVRYVSRLFRGVYYLTLIAPAGNDNIHIPKNKLDTNYKLVLYHLRDSLNCGDCILNFGYQSAAISLNTYFNKVLPPNTSPASRYENISKNFKGLTKRVLQFDFLKERLLFNTAENKQLISRFNKDKTDIYSQFLETNSKMYANEPKENATMVQNGQGVNMSWKDLMDSLRGNVVYIDFWASWCVPCRRAMPDSRKLRSAFIDKPVKFVYISVDDLITQWTEGYKEEGLQKQENYLLLNERKSILNKVLKIKTIPRYVIFDKSGNLVNRDAPGPGDPDVKEMLQKLAKQ